MNHHIRFVKSFAELIGTPFAGDVNALCWSRQLAGDFLEIADRLPPGEGINPITDDDLRALDLSAAGDLARHTLLADQELLRTHGLQPSLDRISSYARDETQAPIATDVYSFHVDRAPLEADTYLCTYVGDCSEGVANEDAMRHIDVAETRAALLRTYGGTDDAGFAGWLCEHSFDLHYALEPAARPFSFGIGNMWRIAIDWPGSPVLPCIHRAPPMPPGAPQRLLLIS